MRKRAIDYLLTKPSDLEDLLCETCPLDRKGVYGVDGGFSAGCEGTKCTEAFDTFWDNLEPIRLSELTSISAMCDNTLPTSIKIQDHEEIFNFDNIDKMSDVLPVVSLMVSQRLFQKLGVSNNPTYTSFKISPLSPYWDVLAQFVRAEMRKAIRTRVHVLHLNIDKLIGVLFFSQGKLPDEVFPKLKNTSPIIVRNALNSLFNSLPYMFMIKLDYVDKKELKKLISTNHIQAYLKNFLETSASEANGTVALNMYLTPFILKCLSGKPVKDLPGRLCYPRVNPFQSRFVLNEERLPFAKLFRNDINTLSHGVRDVLGGYVRVLWDYNSIIQDLHNTGYKPNISWDLRFKTRIPVFCYTTRTLVFYEYYISDNGDFTLTQPETISLGSLREITETETTDIGFKLSSFLSKQPMVSDNDVRHIYDDYTEREIFKTSTPWLTTRGYSDIVGYNITEFLENVAFLRLNEKHYFNLYKVIYGNVKHLLGDENLEIWLNNTNKYQEYNDTHLKFIKFTLKS